MIALIAVLLPLACQDSEATAAASATFERPRLVVMVAVDQMVPEQLDRLAPLFTGAFARFVNEGRSYKNSELRYGATETGPGHATYATGFNPRGHGIVSNAWIPVESAQAVYCVADPDVLPVTSTGPVPHGTGPVRRSVSPKNMRQPAFGDLLKAAVPGATVVSISSKDRAAVTMGGHGPDLAIWWDPAGGGFVTTTYYSDALPDWVSSWNGGWLDRARSGDFEGGWQALPLDADQLERSGTAADDRDGEVLRTLKRTMPYPFPDVSEPPLPIELARAAGAVYGSPIGDAFVIELAMRAIREYELGTDESTDVLMIALSSCDVVGHAFGPTSREVTDTLLRADRSLGSLFDQLDRQVGEGQWVASLTADHGVLALPEELMAQGIGAVRVPVERVAETYASMRAALLERYGDDFVLSAGGGGVRFSEQKIRAAGVDPAEVRLSAAEVLMEEGADWIQTVLTADELIVAEPPSGGWPLLWWTGFDPERSPDLRVQKRPWHLTGYGLGPQRGTSHGSPYSYDRRVPLVFLGPGIEPGTSYAAASSCDAVPTLLHALGLDVPEGLDGRALH